VALFRQWLPGTTPELRSSSDSLAATVLRNYPALPGRITAIKPSPDGKMLLVGDNGGSAVLYDTATAALIAQVSKSGGEILSLDWSGDGTTVVLGRTGGHVEMFRVENGTVRLVQQSELPVKSTTYTDARLAIDGFTVLVRADDTL